MTLWHASMLALAWLEAKLLAYTARLPQMLLFLLRWMTRRLLFFPSMCQQRFFCQSVRAVQRGIVANTAQTECGVDKVHTRDALRCMSDGFERPLGFFPLLFSLMLIFMTFYAILSHFQGNVKIVVFIYVQKTVNCFLLTVSPTGLCEGKCFSTQRTAFMSHVHFLPSQCHYWHAFS